MSDIIENCKAAMAEIGGQEGGAPVEIRCSPDGYQQLKNQTWAKIGPGVDPAPLLGLPVHITHDPADHPYRVLYAKPEAGTAKASQPGDEGAD